MIRCCEFVQFTAGPIDLRFIDAHTTLNEVILCRIPGRSGVVEVEEIHKNLLGKKKKQPSGFSSNGPPRQPSQPQFYRSTKPHVALSGCGWTSLLCRCRTPEVAHGVRQIFV